MPISFNMLRCLCLCSAVFVCGCVHTDTHKETSDGQESIIVSEVGDIESEPVTEMAAVVEVVEHTGERNLEIIASSNPVDLNSIKVAAGKEKASD